MKWGFIPKGALRRVEIERVDPASGHVWNVRHRVRRLTVHQSLCSPLECAVIDYLSGQDHAIGRNPDPPSRNSNVVLSVDDDTPPLPPT